MVAAAAVVAEVAGEVAAREAGEGTTAREGGGRRGGEWVCSDNR